MNIQKTVEELEWLLKGVESVGPVTCRADLDAGIRERETIRQRLGELSGELGKLQHRANRLKMLPNMEIVDWAEACLSMHQLAILVLDTTGVDGNADIIRVYARNQKETLLDITIQPQRHKTANSQYTGITWETLDKSPTLTEAWGDIRHMLSGHFVVSYGLEFVKAHLEENVQHYALQRLPLIGDCLMDQTRRYFDGYGSLKLPVVCHRIGYGLPSPALAWDRAAAQLELLEAMSQGITEVASSPASDDLGDLDKNPF